MKINIINSNQVNNLNKYIKKDYFNMAIGGNYEINKKILDNKKINLLLDPEPLSRDFMKYYDSGLNKVLIKLAKKNNIGIGFTLERLIKLNKLEKVKLFGKIMQNIMICNKYKVNIYIVSFSDKNINDLNSLGISLNAKKINIIQEAI